MKKRDLHELCDDFITLFDLTKESQRIPNQNETRSVGRERERQTDRQTETDQRTTAHLRRSHAQKIPAYILLEQ